MGSKIIRSGWRLGINRTWVSRMVRPAAEYGNLLH